jgi:monothiol glutaredoxin
MDIQEIIRQEVTTHPVVIYMKGTPQFPQCGFSGRAVQVLKAAGAEDLFAVNVLQNPEYVAGVKAFANWPTLPAIFIQGEFIGGCDIATEMYQAGELQPMMKAIFG